MKRSKEQKPCTGEKSNKTGWILGLSVGVLAAEIFYLATGWPFFHFITYAGKKRKDKDRENTKTSENPNRNKWLLLRHTQINHPRNGYEEEYNASKAWCEAKEMEDWYIRSRDGLRLHASYLPAENPKRIVLLSHGYRGTRFGSIAHIAKLLYGEHCSLLFIDQRCCGESEGSYITFGAKEKQDVRAWIEKLHSRNPEGLPIYLYGQSMGATTVLLAAGYKLPEEVRGVIADCGFHSMKQQLRDIASGWFHLHRIGLLLIRVDLFCRIFGHFGMRQTDTTRALAKNKLPVLFFHGERDTYVWPENSRRNYELCQSPKELVLVPRARHLCSSYVAPKLYMRKVREFFRRYD